MPSATEISPLPPDLSQRLPKLIPRQRSKQSPNATKSIPLPPSKPLQAPPPVSSITFSHPERRILSSHDLDLFIASPTYSQIVAFVFTITDSVRNTPISGIPKDQGSVCSAVKSINQIIQAAENLVKECPADDTSGSRFGNPVFRTYLSTLASKLPEWHKTHFPTVPEGAHDELMTYFLSSLGSAARIDYGSGHELHFIIYLLSLYQLSLLPESTFPVLALQILPQYLRLMRILQGTYYLEPAGSHGVWGLDDYHFLPFLFGASQLIGHPFLRPMAIHSTTSIDAYANDFLYLDMVRHVNATKTVEGLRWHSPMLDDISGVKGGWEKVCDGLKKMFLDQVLRKLVVMQHFLFGGLVPAVSGMSEDDADNADLAAGLVNADTVEAIQASGDTTATHPAHAHNPNSWGDCCGIKVPSSIGAVQEMKKTMGTQGLRRLPFD